MNFTDAEKVVLCSLFLISIPILNYCYNFNVNVILDYGKVQPRTYNSLEYDWQINKLISFYVSIKTYFI